MRPLPASGTYWFPRVGWFAVSATSASAAKTSVAAPSQRTVVRLALADGRGEYVGNRGEYVGNETGLMAWPGTT